MRKKYPYIERNHPTQRDLENLSALRSALGEGGSARRSSCVPDPEQDLANSGVTPESSGVEDPESEKDPRCESEEERLERKKKFNERAREARLLTMQNRLEYFNDLRDAGYAVIIRK
jgi:hypothetical protein